jgi:hypothetical protein
MIHEIIIKNSNNKNNFRSIDIDVSNNIIYMPKYETLDNIQWDTQKFFTL